jgi:hypothetical protein
MCDEESDVCVGCLEGEDCDDGLFCNGEESCDEENGSCVSSGDPCLDDGLFCNGEESCDEENGSCVSSGDPCPEGTTCNEGGDGCLPAPPPATIELFPDVALCSHLFPLPLFMFINGTDTHFNETTTVNFNGDAIWPPFYLVLSPTSIFVVSIINPAGLDAPENTSVDVTIISTVDEVQEETTEALTLNMLPWILEEGNRLTE